MLVSLPAEVLYMCFFFSKSEQTTADCQAGALEELKKGGTVIAHTIYTHTHTQIFIQTFIISCMKMCVDYYRGASCPFLLV